MHVDFDPQDHVLGYVLRQQLIHNVRREYEQISDNIQTPELLQNLPPSLANETICWPREDMLCFPAFTTQRLCEPRHCFLGNSSPFGSEEKGDDPSASRMREGEVHTPTPNHSPLANKASCPQAMCSLSQLAGNEELDSHSLECLVDALPRNCEALLELKSQLTMDLMWIKQAIASRQEVSLTAQCTQSLITCSDLLSLSPHSICNLNKSCRQSCH